MKHLPLFLLLLYSCNTSEVEKPLPEHKDTTAVAKQVDPQKEELEKAFALAIADYIKANGKHHDRSFDTLFFLLHSEFPEIQLPSSIEGVGIFLGTQEEVDKKRTYRQTLYAVNLFGWLNKTNAEFIFVTFNPGYQHDFDHFINYENNTIKELRYEDYIYNKQGNLEQIKVYVDGKYEKDKPILNRK